MTNYGPPTWLQFRMCALLQEMTLDEAMVRLGIGRWKAQTLRKFVMVPPKRFTGKLRMDDAVWTSAARAVAAQERISFKAIVMGDCTRTVAHARWRAFKLALDTNPKLTLHGLACISGFDRSTIVVGLDRLRGEPARSSVRVGCVTENMGADA